MNRENFKYQRQRLGLSQSGLADWLHCDKRTVGRWENGEREIPGPVEVCMEAFAAGYRP